MPQLLPKQRAAYRVLANPDTRYILYGGGAGGGKAHPLTEPVLTRHGFVPIGSLRVGDKVVDNNNEEVEVIGVHDRGRLDVYRIEFIDGSHSIASGDHLWLAWQSRRKARERIYTTLELKQALAAGRNMLIPLASPLEFGKPYTGTIHPYIVGALLGDGGLTKAVTFTTADEEVVTRIRSLLPDGVTIYKTKAAYSYTISNKLHDENGYPYSPFLDEIRALGMNKRSDFKTIPAPLLNADLNTRLELIRGLMDTDGTIDTRGHCSFTSSSRQLAEDLQYLIRSVGGKATLRQKEKFFTYKGERRYKTAYELYINSKDNSQFFTLPRKLARVKPYNGGGGAILGKRIISIEKVGNEPCRCISVSGANKLYITRDFTVTHNSWLGCEWLMQCAYYLPETRWFVGRNNIKDTRESVIITFKKVADAHGFDEYRITDSGIEFENGSHILFLDCTFYPYKDPFFERFGSKEFTGGWIEEAGQVHALAFDVLKSRIGRHLNTEYNVPPKMLLTANPRKNWLYKQFYLPYKNGELPPSHAFIQSLATDNTKLPAEYLEQLRNISDRATRERLLRGNWEYDDDPTALIPYEIILSVFDGIAPVTDGTRYLTADIALQGSDKLVVAVWAGHTVMHVETMPKATGREVVERLEAISRHYKVPPQNVAFDADGVGAYLSGFLRAAFAFHNNAKPFARDGHTIEQYQNLKTQCYYELAKAANAGTLKIAARLSESVKAEIIEEMEQVKSYDTDRDGKLKIQPKAITKQAIGRSPDYTDALAMRFAFDLKPRPRNIAIDF